METDEIKKLAEKSMHISIEEMEADIAETEKEIDFFKNDLDSAQKWADRWKYMKAMCAIKERKDFVKNLRQIIAYRKSIL